MITPLKPYLDPYIIAPLQAIVTEYVGIPGFYEVAAQECTELDNLVIYSAPEEKKSSAPAKVLFNPNYFPLFDKVISAITGLNKDKFRCTHYLSILAYPHEPTSQDFWTGRAPKFHQLLLQHQKISTAFKELLDYSLDQAPASRTRVTTCTLEAGLQVALFIDFRNQFSAQVTTDKETYDIKSADLLGFPIAKIDSTSEIEAALRHYTVEVIRSETFQLKFHKTG